MNVEKHEPFDATREDLGNGLTRRRPALGEVDYAQRDSVWIYESVLRMSTPVDAPSTLRHPEAEAYVRDLFAKEIEKAAVTMRYGRR